MSDEREYDYEEESHESDTVDYGEDISDLLDVMGVGTGFYYRDVPSKDRAKWRKLYNLHVGLAVRYPGVEQYAPWAKITLVNQLREIDSLANLYDVPNEVVKRAKLMMKIWKRENHRSLGTGVTLEYVAGVILAIAMESWNVDFCKRAWNLDLVKFNKNKYIKISQKIIERISPFMKFEKGLEKVIEENRKKSGVSA